MTKKVSFRFAKGGSLCGFLVDHPIHNLFGFVVFANEGVFPSGDGVIAPSRFALIVEGANVASERDVLVVETTNAGQVVEAVDVSFGELVFFLVNS